MTAGPEGFVERSGPPGADDDFRPAHHFPTTGSARESEEPAAIAADRGHEQKVDVPLVRRSDANERIDGTRKPLVWSDGDRHIAGKLRVRMVLGACQANGPRRHHRHGSVHLHQGEVPLPDQLARVPCQRQSIDDGTQDLVTGVVTLRPDEGRVWDHVYSSHHGTATRVRVADHSPGRIMVGTKLSM